MFQRPLDCRKVEIINHSVSESVPVYWIATIIRVAGNNSLIQPILITHGSNQY